MGSVLRTPISLEPSARGDVSAEKVFHDASCGAANHKSCWPHYLRLGFPSVRARSFLPSIAYKLVLESCPCHLGNNKAPHSQNDTKTCRSEVDSVFESRASVTFRRSRLELPISNDAISNREGCHECTSTFSSRRSRIPTAILPSMHRYSTKSWTRPSNKKQTSRLLFRQLVRR